MAQSDIEQLIQLLSKLPGLGPRSARRAALHLVQHKDDLLRPLAGSIDAVMDTVRTCSTCGNLDTQDPCHICTEPKRDASSLCVVEDVADLWAMERAAVYRGRYHVLGGTLSALDGVGPEDLRIPQLVARVKEGALKEVILATNLTVDGQTTAHYIADALAGTGVTVSGLAHGIPVGGELDYLDEGTLSQALRARRPL